MFVAAVFSGNGIVAAFSPRVAAQDSFGRKITSVKQAVHF